MRGRGLRILGVCVLTFVQSYEIMEADGMPVGVVRLTERMEALSSAVLNGGDSVVSAVFIMQVSKNYDHPDPAAHADAVRRELGLPEDSLGMMTAAEVRHVFNVREVGFEGAEVTAIATAGLSNHVVAGEVLDDYDEKSAVSAMRARALAGTINICVVSPVPLSTAGKVNLMIPLVEGKSVAMAEHGFLETGTTSDSMAVISPIGEGRVDWTGTGSNIGIAAARAVSAAVGYALDVRDEHPMPMTASKLLAKMGLDADGLRAMCGSDADPEGYRRSLEETVSSPVVSAAADMVWSSAQRADSLAEDGDPRELDILTEAVAGVIGASPSYEGGLLDRFVRMLSERVDING